MALAVVASVAIIAALKLLKWPPFSGRARRSGHRTTPAATPIGAGLRTRQEEKTPKAVHFAGCADKQYPGDGPSKDAGAEAPIGTPHAHALRYAGKEGQVLDSELQAQIDRIVPGDNGSDKLMLKPAEMREQFGKTVTLEEIRTAGRLSSSIQRTPMVSQKPLHETDIRDHFIVKAPAQVDTSLLSGLGPGVSHHYAQAAIMQTIG